jgi:hypothetical protein
MTLLRDILTTFDDRTMQLPLHLAVQIEGGALNDAWQSDALEDMLIL